MKEYFCVAVTCSLFGFAIGCMSQAEMKSSTEGKPLCLVVKTDKNRCSPGEDILITCTLSNCSSKAVHLLPWGGLREVEWIHVLNDQLKEGTNLYTADIDFVPLRADDFLMLAPGQSLSRRFVGRVEEGLVELDNGGQYNGLYLAFYVSLTMLERPGVYRVFAEYSADVYWADKARELFGYKDVFVGSVTSQWVTVDIQRKR